MIEAARSRGTAKGLEFRKRQFDGIEIRTVGRQEPESRAHAFDGRLDLRLFMAREIVEDDDVAGPQRRHQHLLDIGQKRGIVDRAVEHGGRGEAVDAQAGDHRVGLPMAAGRVIPEPDPAGTPTIAPQQVRGDARLVDEDVGARVVYRLGVLPVPARRGYVRTALLVGVYRFF